MINTASTNKPIIIRQFHVTLTSTTCGGKQTAGNAY